MSQGFTTSMPLSDVDEGNSTSVALSGAATWTGEWKSGRGFQEIIFYVASDVDGTLTAQFSPDASNVDLELDYEFDASAINPPGRLMIVDKYYRIKYVNGSGAQSHMRLQTRLNTGSGILGTPLNIAVPKDADATVVRSIGDELGMAEGKFSGHSIVNKFGRNEDVDSGSTPETIWRGGGLYTGQPVSTSETVDVYSSDAADKGTPTASTGALTLVIEGLDANWVFQSETITMDGTNVVVSNGTYRRVNRAYVATAGSGGVNAGTITIEHSTTSANVFATIPAGENGTQILAYTVPANHIGIIRQCNVQLDRSASATATCRLRTRESAAAWRDRDVFSLSEAGPYVQTYYGGITCAEKCDIRVDVTTASTTNMIMTGRLGIIIVEQ